jgi:hypothetical protein
VTEASKVHHEEYIAKENAYKRKKVADTGGGGIGDWVEAD